MILPVCEAFLDEEKKFYLSHRYPVNPPVESAVTHDASMLSRKEVVIARAIFQYCMDQAPERLSCPIHIFFSFIYIL